MATPVYKKTTSERVEFTLIDMIRALRGFRSPEGYVVIPNGIAEKIENEITRLYEVEEMAVALAIESSKGLSPMRSHPLIVAILGEPETEEE